VHHPSRRFRNTESFTARSNRKPHRISGLSSSSSQYCLLYCTELRLSFNHLNHCPDDSRSSPHIPGRAEIKPITLFSPDCSCRDVLASKTERDAEHNVPGKVRYLVSLHVTQKQRVEVAVPPQRHDDNCQPHASIRTSLARLRTASSRRSHGNWIQSTELPMHLSVCSFRLMLQRSAFDLSASKSNIASQKKGS
jgi:hypothetical protein